MFVNSVCMYARCMCRTSMLLPQCANWGQKTVFWMWVSPPTCFEVESLLFRHCVLCVPGQLAHELPGNSLIFASPLTEGMLGLWIHLNSAVFFYLSSQDLNSGHQSWMTNTFTEIAPHHPTLIFLGQDFSFTQSAPILDGQRPQGTFCLCLSCTVIMLQVSTITIIFLNMGSRGLFLIHYTYIASTLPTELFL